MCEAGRFHDSIEKCGCERLACCVYDCGEKYAYYTAFGYYILEDYDTLTLKNTDKQITRRDLFRVGFMKVAARRGNLILRGLALLGEEYAEYYRYPPALVGAETRLGYSVKPITAKLETTRMGFLRPWRVRFFLANLQDVPFHEVKAGLAFAEHLIREKCGGDARKCGLPTRVDVLVEERIDSDAPEVVSFAFIRESGDGEQPTICFKACYDPSSSRGRVCFAKPGALSLETKYLDTITLEEFYGLIAESRSAEEIVKLVWGYKATQV